MPGYNSTEVVEIFEKATFFQQRGEISNALALYRKIEDTLMTYGDYSGQGALLLNLGNALSHAASYDEATRTLRGAIAIYRTIGNKGGEAKTQKNLASNFESQGHYQSALDAYRRALDLFEEIGEREAAGRVMNDLGVLHKNLNQYMNALSYYLAAREIFRGKEQSESLRDLLANLDTLFSKLHLLLSQELAEKARYLFERDEIIEMAELLETGSVPWKTGGRASSVPTLTSPDLSELPMSQTKGSAETLLLLARHYMGLGKVTQAVEEMWGAAGTFWIREKQYDRAINLFYKAGQICETHGLRHKLIHISQQLGSCIAQAGRLVEAREILEDTIEEASSRNLFPALWQARSELADVLRKLNQPSQAVNQLSLAIEEVEQQARAFKHISRIERFLDDKITLYQRLVDLLIQAGDSDKAYEVVLKAKSSPLANFSGHIKRAQPTKLSQRMQQKLNQARRSMHHWLFECEELRVWSEACEDNWNLPSVTPTFYTANVIRQRLDQKSAIVDFFFTDTKLCTFIVRHSGLKCFPINITQEEIFSKVSEEGFLANISGRRGLQAIPTMHALLREWLGSHLMEILTEENISQLCFCLHGILHLLPVKASITTKQPKADFISWYVPHTSFFHCLGGPSGSAEFRYLGIGNPGQDLKADIEIVEASKYFDQNKRRVIINEPVSRDAALAEMQFADVIHLACHGYLRDDMSELSYLDLGQGERLRAIDILSRGRTNAKLVILSACWTSIGRVGAADEIGSLARAFLYVGAEAVLATLWPVPDKATTNFIKDFFRLWMLEQKSVRMAFNCAQELYRDTPIVWSGFVLLEAATQTPAPVTL